jgi:hypothetical protein
MVLPSDIEPGTVVGITVVVWTVVDPPGHDGQRAVVGTTMVNVVGLATVSVVGLTTVVV